LFLGDLVRSQWNKIDIRIRLASIFASPHTTEIPICPSRYNISKGSRKNKFTFLGVEAPVWQGAKAHEYRDICVLSQRSQAGWIGA
jgi:hypothetical protein